MKQCPKGNISNWYSSNSILCVTSIAKGNTNDIKRRMGTINKVHYIGLILFLSGKK